MDVRLSRDGPPVGGASNSHIATALGWELGAYSDEPAFALEHLKEPTFTLATDPSDNIQARTESIGFYNNSTHRKSTAAVRRS